MGVVFIVLLYSILREHVKYKENIGCIVFYVIYTHIYIIFLQFLVGVHQKVLNVVKSDRLNNHISNLKIF